MRSSEERKRTFILGLEKLTRENGIIIGGCGCCGSPYLSNAEEGKLTEEAGYKSDEIMWVSPSDDYDWKEYSHQIVKI